MGTKNNPGRFDCYANAEADEPMFVLLARDRHAPALVWLWAALRERDGEDAVKVDEARACAAKMMDWAHDHERPIVGLSQAVLAGVTELIQSNEDVVKALHGEPGRHIIDGQTVLGDVMDLIQSNEDAVKALGGEPGGRMTDIEALRMFLASNLFADDAATPRDAVGMHIRAEWRAEAQARGMACRLTAAGCCFPDCDCPHVDDGRAAAIGSPWRRAPQNDKRIGRGDDFSGDAWRHEPTGEIQWTAAGHAPDHPAG